MDECCSAAINAGVCFNGEDKLHLYGLYGPPRGRHGYRTSRHCLSVRVYDGRAFLLYSIVDGQWYGRRDGENTTITPTE